MKHVISLFIILFICPFVNGQIKSDKLQKEQKILEKKITQTKALLNKVQNNAKNSFTEITLLDNQIKNREELVRIYDGQVRVSEVKMIEKENEIKRLMDKLSSLKMQYKKMIFFAYKNRNKAGKLMFLLSSNTYNEAQKRNLYLKKVANLQQKQVGLIKLHHGLINNEIVTIKQEKTAKEIALDEKKSEREKIELDKDLKENNYQKFKAEEVKLFDLLKENERKKAELKSRISAAIRQEIAASQANERKKEAARKKEEARKREEAKKKENKKDLPKTAVSAPVKNSDPVKVVKYEAPVSSEGSITGKNFEANKGRLPSPVSNGSITEKYGKNAHPTLAGVYTNNNGIDITCSGNSKARAVFEGVVSAIINVNGAGKVVIIKHGNYRSVYSNLQETYVKVGDKISAKQNIGVVMLDGGSVSILHFEIHLIVGLSTQSLNPSLWISR
jgi:septal ring factor EnvC (AmiA/AmiB activator)